MTTHFLVHNKIDKVGVVVVEDVKAGEALTGWLLEDDSTIRLEAKDDIRLGHKIALTDIADGDTIMEYEHDIGRAIADIGMGHHVHVHNIKTKRW